MIASISAFPKPQNSGRVTLKEIAKASGVSTATVSLALRNSPRISEERKRTVAEVCERLGYIRDDRLSELMSRLRNRSGKVENGSLAVVKTGQAQRTRAEDAAHEAILRGLKGQAEQRGYLLNIFDAPREGLNAKSLKRILEARGIEAMVLLPSNDHSLLESFDFSGLAALCIGYEGDFLPVNRICPNYMGMMDGLMESVLKQGYRRFGFLALSGRGRMRSRLLNASIDFKISEAKPASRVADFAGTLEDRYELRRWLETEQPDMIIGDLASLEAVRLQGISIPEEIGFAAFDTLDSPANISGLEIPYVRMGEESIRVIASDAGRSANRRGASFETIVIEGSFRLGSSSSIRSCLETELAS